MYNGKIWSVKIQFWQAAANMTKRQSVVHTDPTLEGQVNAEKQRFLIGSQQV